MSSEITSVSAPSLAPEIAGGAPHFADAGASSPAQQTPAPLDHGTVRTIVAGNREKPRRHRRPVVGGTRLSACRNGDDAALRQALRHLRQTPHPDVGDRDFCRRFRRLRAGAEDLDADSGAWFARHWRWGAIADCA